MKNDTGDQIKDAPQRLTLTDFEAYRPTILVVDDALINLTLLAKGLEADYRVVTATSGLQGLALAKSEHPDVILLDVMMPEMDGYAVAKLLSLTPELARIPIFFLTAQSDQESQLHGLELGAVDFLTKPFSLKILKKRIANVIERDQLRIKALQYQTVLNDLLLEQTAAKNILESVFNASSDALIVTNRTFQISRVNRNAEKMLRGTAAELINTPLRRFRFTLQDDTDLPIDTISTNAAWVEGKLCTPDGQFLRVAILCRSFETTEKDAGYLFSLQDISIRVALEEKRQLAEQQRNDALLELGIQKAAMDEHALVSMTDRQGNITYVNDKFCATSGFKPDELLGNTHRLIRSERHSPEFYEDVWKTVTQGHTWHGEITNRGKDGRLYTVESTIVPWRDARGVPYQYVAISTDITARKAAEQELALARQRELALGATIQQSLLFGKPPTNLEGVSVACFTEASNGVDGDFYTFTEINSQCFEVLTGDVMGKGVNAALIAAGIKNTYHKTFTALMSRHQGKAAPTPADIINAVHAVITPELIRIESFVTLSLVRVNRLEQSVTWVNAGHTPTLLARHDGQQVIELLGDNPPVGVLEAEVFVEHVTPIGVGDALLLYSDGISEALDPDKNEYGTNRIKSILLLGQTTNAHPSVTLNSLRSDLSNHTRHLGPSDDSTAIFIRMNPLKSGVRATIAERRAPEFIELPRQLDSLGLVRQKIAQVARDQPEEFVHLLQLGAFEAATNIVRHTSPHVKNAPMTVAFSRTADAIRVELIYVGIPFVPPDAPTPDFSGDSEGGFGLFIMKSAVDQVDYYSPLPGLAGIRLVKQLAQP
jgi:sigma-B regulation protein RsbU (phosphoserine phosphatase)